MKTPIARVRIASGNPGWYDPLTNIHLTITRPEAVVYEGQNVTNIKTAVLYKLVQVVEGELEPVKVSIPAVKVEEKVEEVQKKVREVVEEKSVVEAKEETVEVEEVAEKAVEEKKPAKKTTKRSTKKKAE